MKKFLTLTIVTVATLFNLTFTTEDTLASSTNPETVYMYADDDLPSEH